MKNYVKNDQSSHSLNSAWVCTGQEHFQIHRRDLSSLHTVDAFGLRALSLRIPEEKTGKYRAD
jgi:hypothetical protein